MSGYNFTPNTGPLSSDSAGNQIFWMPVIYMGIKSSALTATGTAAKLTGTPLAGRKVVMITNNSASDILYIGDNSVTTATGTPISAGAVLIIMIADNIDLWIVSSGASTDTRILEGL